jgi:hypothetical protein
MKLFGTLLPVSALLFICFESGPAATENVLRWASPGGAATFDPRSFR